MKKFIEVYAIEDDFAKSFFNNDYIFRTITNKIEEYDSWKFGVNPHL